MQADTLITPLIEMARQAGQAMLSFYGGSTQALAITAKADNTPVTQADLASHVILQRAISQLTPTVPILSEEGEIPPFSIRQHWTDYWLVDPLDGTKEFIAGTDEFCICIALMHQQSPQLGLIYLPITDTAYYAVSGQGAFKQTANQAAHALQPSKVATDRSLRVTLSRRHLGASTQALLAAAGDYELFPCGSAIKFARVAEGSCDVYPCTGKTLAWDTAAGQCLLEAVGGALLDASGQSLRYNTREQLRNPQFLAVADSDYPWQHLLDALP